ncbi:MAG TPA: type III-A CRISPR-associated RAMP protein Csm3 [Candidatus Margulisbacteria bacterium]|nr:MAG: type III-A CRISPR-associated RAMP protein Csm3 [Candidatus Margulisbacteria bacterium GWF2_38_17]HCT84706.1 type III-A CRISPR-associated RAMP protein Csm3 [Candidatus Margulisiibacteriota bacterium]
MKLEKFIKITGIIELLSGLHIGSGNDEIHIGGIDNPVIKNPLDNVPYIPGSSIKGKMRSLLEMTTNRVTDGKPFSGSSDDVLCKLFGNGTTDKEFKGGPTRLVFNDCRLINASDMKKKNALTEDKSENSIDRVIGTAKDPRHMERVPAGAIFELRIVYKKLSTDDETIMKGFIMLGLRLLEIDCLGGSGSRGYGRIKINNLKIDNEVVKLSEIDINSEISKYELKVK